MDKFREFLRTMSEAEQASNQILGVIIVAAIIWSIVWKWMKELDMVQRIVLSVAGIVGLLWLILRIWRWWGKRNVEQIPELLTRIDQLTLDYIDAFEPKSETSEDMMDDLAELLKMDISGLKNACKNRDKRRTEQEFQRIMRQYERFINPKKKVEENLQNALLMGSMLDEYNAGLTTITNTDEYHRLYNRIRQLQRQVPTAEISMKINEYWRWSNALYCVLLSTKPTLGYSEMKQLIPVRVRATKGILRPTFEGYTATLISAVRESIYKSKHRGETEKKGGSM